MTVEKTVLITGALGKLGQRVVRILIQRGHKVIALDLKTKITETIAEQLNPPVGCSGTLIVEYVNLLEPSTLQSVFAMYQPGVIVHLAAIVSPPCYRNPRFARRVNVEGTKNLIEAAKTLPVSPFVIEASSTAVYGSRNPYRYPELVTSVTPVNPVDCYGEDKVAAEQIVAGSGLPHATLRLGGIMSPDSITVLTSDYLLLARATPRDNRIHTVDARDAALAFANAAELGAELDGKILLIGGDSTHLLLHGDIQDDASEALGIGRIGKLVGLPGNPDDDRGWGLTVWFDTAETERLLNFQKHTWSDTLICLAESQRRSRKLLRVISPFLLLLIRAFYLAQRVTDRRGKYADPWSLISRKYGQEILASSSRQSPTAMRFN